MGGSAYGCYHGYEDSDHFIWVASLHVLTDILISLSNAMIWDIPFIDTITAIISSLVIIRWSVGLLKNSGKSTPGYVSLDSLAGLIFERPEFIILVEK